MPFFEQVKMVCDKDARIISLLHNVTTNGNRKLMGDKARSRIWGQHRLINFIIRKMKQSDATHFID
jgi:hypothetical protein